MSRRGLVGIERDLRMSIMEAADKVKRKRKKAQSSDKVGVFFTEAAFYRFMPQPTFEERLPQWLSRFHRPEEESKPEHIDLNKSTKSKCSSKHSFKEKIVSLKEQVSLKRRSSSESSKDLSNVLNGSFEGALRLENNTLCQEQIPKKGDCENDQFIDKNNCKIRHQSESLKEVSLKTDASSEHSKDTVYDIASSFEDTKSLENNTLYHDKIPKSYDCEKNNFEFRSQIESLKEQVLLKRRSSCESSKDLSDVLNGSFEGALRLENNTLCQEQIPKKGDCENDQFIDKNNCKIRHQTESPKEVSLKPDASSEHSKDTVYDIASSFEDTKSLENNTLYHEKIPESYDCEKNNFECRSQIKEQVSLKLHSLCESSENLSNYLVGSFERSSSPDKNNSDNTKAADKNDCEIINQFELLKLDATCKYSSELSYNNTGSMESSNSSEDNTLYQVMFLKKDSWENDASYKNFSEMSNNLASSFEGTNSLEDMSNDLAGSYENDCNPENNTQHLVQIIDDENCENVKLINKDRTTKVIVAEICVNSEKIIKEPDNIEPIDPVDSGSVEDYGSDVDVESLSDSSLSFVILSLSDVEDESGSVPSEPQVTSVNHKRKVNQKRKVPRQAASLPGVMPVVSFKKSDFSPTDSPRQILSSNGEVSSVGNMPVLHDNAEAAHLSQVVHFYDPAAVNDVQRPHKSAAHPDSGTGMESLSDDSLMQVLSNEENYLECDPVFSQSQIREDINREEAHQATDQPDPVSAISFSADSLHPDNQWQINEFTTNGNLLVHPQSGQEQSTLDSVDHSSINAVVQSSNKVGIFFTEASFYQYVRQPTFQERLPQWLSRFPPKKPKRIDLDKPIKSKDSFHDQIVILREQVSLKRRSSCESSKDTSIDHASSFEGTSGPEDNTLHEDSIVDKNNCKNISVTVHHDIPEVLHNVQNFSQTVHHDIPEVSHNVQNFSRTVHHDIPEVSHNVQNFSQTVHHDIPEVSHNVQNFSQTVCHDIPEVSHNVQNFSQTVRHDIPEVSHNVQNFSQTVHQDIPEVSHNVQHLSQTVHQDIPEVSHNVQHISQTVHQDIPEVSHNVQHISQTVHQDIPEVSHNVQYISQTVHQDIPEVSHNVQHLSQTVHQDIPQVSHNVQHLSQTVLYDIQEVSHDTQDCSHDLPAVAQDGSHNVAQDVHHLQVSEGDPASADENDHVQESLSDSVLCLVMPSLSDEDEEHESDPTFPEIQMAEKSVKREEPPQVTDQPDVMSAKTLTPDSLHPESQQHILSCNEVSSNWNTLTHPPTVEQQCTINNNDYLSEQDIPIFSVKEDAPSPASSAGSVQVNPAKKNNIWAAEMKEQCSGNDAKQLSKSTSVSDDPNSNSSYQRSDLTMDEHATYLKLYNKYVRPYFYARPPQIHGQQHIHELSVLQSLQRRVMNEQQAFQKYLYSLALKNPKGYGFLKSGARHYSSNKACAYHLKKSYEQRFSPAAKCHIPLDSRSSGAELAFCQTLLEVGLPPRIVLPDIQSGSKPVPIPQDLKKLDYLFPRISSKTFPGYIHHEPVSLDGNMKALLIKYGVQIAMSSSVISCLLNNHGPEYAKTWNIPVTIEMCQSGDFSFKVVCLDKPLFEEDLVIRDYSALYHKYAFRSFVSHPRKRTRSVSRVASLPEHVNEKSYDDTFDLFSSDADSLETFGTSFSRPASKKTSAKEGTQKSSTICGTGREPEVKRSQAEVKLAESFESTEISKLALHSSPSSLEGARELESPSSPSQSPIASPPMSPISVLPDESHTVKEIPLSPIKSDQPQSLNCSTSSPKTTATFRRPVRGLPRTSSHDPKSNISVITPVKSLLSPLDSILGQHTKSTDPSDEPAREDPSLYMPPTEDCSSLLYNLFTIGGKQILIRCRCHGILKSRPVYIVPKMEYQTNFGYEQVTQKEAVKCWTACYIRQKTNLLRVRINSFNSEILMYEELEPHQILAAAFNFQPQVAFQFLDNILNHLISLDCGKYLLSHEEGADFCAIRCQKPVVSQDQRETEPVTVKKIKNDTSVPWIPIDPTLLTQHHITNNRIPATFLPKDFVYGRKNTSKKQGKNGSNKGKGRKKGRQGQNGENNRRNAEGKKNKQKKK